MNNSSAPPRASTRRLCTTLGASALVALFANCSDSLAPTRGLAPRAASATIVSTTQDGPLSLSVSVIGALGSEGWYRAPVIVQWPAVDQAAPNAPWAACDKLFIEDDQPETTYSCTATSSGHSVTASVKLKVDLTKPVVSYSGNLGTYAIDQMVDITCSATDATSGIASSTCADVHAPAYTFQPTSNVLIATATDHAGNSGTGLASFTVTVTQPGLCALVQQLSTNAGVANSLCAKLSNGNYGAFRNEVAAQAGKKISSSDAAVLVRLSSFLG